MRTQKHPPALYVIFFTEIWERFSYYGMRAILILYLVKSFQAGGLGVEKVEALHFFGLFTSLIAVTPLLGGLIADKYIGRRWGVQIGAFCCMLGEFVIFFMNSWNGILVAFVILAIGHAFFKPNIVALLGEFYENDDPRKDSAFSLFYMAVNIGAFLAPLVVGFVAEELFAVKEGGEIISYGYRYGFAVTASGMLIGQLIFAFFGKKHFGDKGLPPKRKSLTDEPKKKLTKVEMQRIAVIFILSVFVVSFWVGFEQAGSSFNLYTDSYINREVSGFLIPTSWFQSLNPLFIIILTPIFVWFWQTKGATISTPKKMGYGTIFLGIGFLFLLGAVYERGGDVKDVNIKANMLWLVMVYLAHTIGELMLSPIGNAAVTKLSPKGIVSFMVAVWFFAAGLARYISGFVAGFVETMGAVQVFQALALFSIGTGIVIIFLSPLVEKWMHGVR